MSEFRELLTDRLRGIFALSDSQVDQLERHYELLVKWNRAINLTSIRKSVDIVERHYCESLFLAKHLLPGRQRIVDVGSGAGFPGIPVAIALPHSSVALVESHQRKAVFLREASRVLPNVSVLAVRAETVSERYDWAISRAVKWSYIANLASMFASSVAFLGGELTPTELPGLDTTVRIPLPWGRQRFLYVSRGTA